MRVCITADDLGLRTENDRAITMLAEAGRIDAVALMLHHGSTVSDRLPANVSLGLHVVLVGERPLRAQTLARWLDVDGRLPASWAALAAALARHGGPLASALEEEIDAQLERFADLGRPLDLLNAHQHVHLLPPVWHAVSRQLARRRWRPVIRVLRGRSPKAAAIRLASIVSFARGTPAAMSYARGVDWSGHASGARVEATLRAIARDASPVLHELVFHPGDDAGLVAARHARWGYAWTSETALLASGDVDARLDSFRIRRARPRALP